MHIVGTQHSLVVWRNDWNRHFSGGPQDLFSRYVCPYAISPSWVWAELSDSVLTNRIWQKWWEVASKIRLQKDCLGSAFWLFLESTATMWWGHLGQLMEELKEWETVWDWNVLHPPPQNSWAEAPTLNSTVSGDKAFKEIIKVKWRLRGGAVTQCGCSLYKKRWEHQVSTEQRSYEDTERRLPSASQGERPQRKPDLDLGLPVCRTVRKLISIV